MASDIVLGHDTLPMLSVDSLLEMYGWDHVDVLKMDTEGQQVMSPSYVLEVLYWPF